MPLPSIDPNGEGPRKRGPEAVHLVRAALVRAGWRVQLEVPAVGDGRVDLVASKGSKRLSIEVKAIAEGRADRLIPLWSQAWLQASHDAPKGHHPVAIVAADRIAESAVDSVLHFVQQYAPDAHAGVIDLGGRIRFHGPLLHGIEEDPAENVRLHNRREAPVGNLFSDLNQWMIKVLLAPAISEHLLSAPRAHYHGPSDLGHAAGASAMSASRLLSQLGREGYLDDRAPYVRLVRIRDLLERWQSAVAARQSIESYWRAHLRGGVDRALASGFKSERGCLALFAAARELRYGFVAGVLPHIYVASRHANAGRAWDGFAVADNAGSADVIARRPNAPQSVFRGMVMARGVPVCDILQVWLDVGSHPSRGREQANLIWNKVLKPVAEAD